MSDRTSKAYSRALNELRRRHLDEFEQVYAEFREAEGLSTLADKNVEQKQRIIDLIKSEIKAEGRGPGVTKISELLEIPISSAVLWCRELREEGRVIAPGSGNRSGYRLP